MGVKCNASYWGRDKLIRAKRKVRDLVPSILIKWIRLVKRNSIMFSGRYGSWADAQRVSTGYDSAKIFKRACEAALKVKNGQAVFERDSVCFYHEEYRWPTLACLLAISSQNGGHLNVLDFGGALGSFYSQHKKFFDRLIEMRWAVVEQNHFVEFGREKIEDQRLQFYESIDDCLSKGAVDVILFSGVLQYLHHPYVILDSLALRKIPFLIIDRIAFIDAPEDRLTVQHVPEAIYKASYPAWFFSRQRFDTAIKDMGYRLISDFPCDVDKGMHEYKGLFYEKQTENK